MPQGINGARITGFEEILKNLDIEIRKITQGAQAGCVRAANYIHRDVEKTMPLTPLRTNVLRASWQNKPIQRNKEIGVVFGYNANYAKWVHFMEKAKYWTRPGSGALWLELSIIRNHDRMLQIVAEGIKDNK